MLPVSKCDDAFSLNIAFIKHCWCEYEQAESVWQGDSKKW